MSNAFKRGDLVEWNSEAGRVRGIVVGFRLHIERFAGALFESLYADWAMHGNRVLEGLDQPERGGLETCGMLMIDDLAFVESAICKLPGVTQVGPMVKGTAGPRIGPRYGPGSGPRALACRGEGQAPSR